nr:MAG TPA: hypothetical protein [Caudoviricetes sp.]
MSEPKFTPGPHKVKILGKEKTSVIICSSDGRPLASLYHEKTNLLNKRLTLFYTLPRRRCTMNSNVLPSSWSTNSK